MKKIIPILSALALAACSQVEITAPEDYPLPEKEGPAQITLAFACPSEVSFTAGDQISVFSMAEPDSHRVFDFDRYEGGKALFCGVATRAATYCAVAPYNASNKLGFVDGDGSQCSLEASLPSQQGTESSFGLYTAMADSSNLEFFGICAKVSIPLYKAGADTAKGIMVSIEGLAGESLSGAMKIVMHKGAAPVYAKATGTGSAMTIVKDVNICASAPQVEMIVAPQTLSEGYKVSVTLDDGTTVAVCDISDPRSLSPSKTCLLQQFEYAPKYYIRYECTSQPDLGGYKVETKGETSGKVWFFTSEVPASLCKGKSTITKLIIPSFITGLGESCFQAMSALDSVEFESGSKCAYFGKNCFQGATSLRSMVIPASVDSLMYGALQGATALTSLAFEKDSHCKKFCQNAMYNVNKLKKLVIPASVEVIGPYSMQNMAELCDLSYEDGSNLKTMDTKCLEGDTKLTTLVIPASVTYINNPAPSTKYTPKLTLYAYPTVPPTLIGKIGNGTGQLSVIYVPAGSVEDYKAATEPSGTASTGWNRYTSKIQTMPAL